MCLCVSHHLSELVPRQTEKRYCDWEAHLTSSPPLFLQQKYKRVCVHKRVHETLSQALRHAMYCPPTPCPFIRLLVLPVYSKRTLRLIDLTHKAPGILSCCFRRRKLFFSVIKSQSWDDRWKRGHFFNPALHGDLFYTARVKAFFCDSLHISPFLLRCHSYMKEIKQNQI